MEKANEPEKDQEEYELDTLDALSLQKDGEEFLGELNTQYFVNIDASLKGAKEKPIYNNGLT